MENTHNCDKKYYGISGTYPCEKPYGHDPLGEHVTHINGGKYVWKSGDLVAEPREWAGWFKAEYKSGVLGDFSCANIKGYSVDKTGVLEFTAPELAELYVILAGNHDIPEVYLNKIGAALKEML